MKKLRLKNLFKYSLVFVGALCAMIAGVFALQKDNVKAEEVIKLTPNIALNKIDIVKDVNGAKDIAVSATLSGDALANFNKGEFDIKDYYHVGGESQFITEALPYGVVCSERYYYILSVYPGSNESERNVSFDTIIRNSSSNTFAKDMFQIGTSKDYTETNGNFIFNLPVFKNIGDNVTLPPILWDEFNGSDRPSIKYTFSQDYTWFIDMYLVKEEQLCETAHAAQVTGWWFIDSTKPKFTYEKVFSSKDYIQTSLEDVSRNKLSDLASDETADVDYLFWTAGFDDYTAETQVPLNINYKEMSGYDVVDVSSQFNIPARIMFNQEEIIKYVAKLSDKKDLTDYNCNLVERYYENDETFETSSRVYLQADKFVYSFDETLKIANLNVEYVPFRYKDFYLKISNNEPGNNLMLNYYTSNVSTIGNQTMLVYEFNKIQEHLKNKANWLFALKQADFSIGELPDGVYSTLTDSSLIISFETGKESNLLNFDVSVVTQITEDVAYTFTYTYASLNNDLVETQITSAPTVKMFSWLQSLSAETFYINYGKTIDAAVSPAVLEGQDFFIFSTIKKYYDHDKKTCNVVVEYRFKTLLKLKSSSSATYKALTKNSTLYTYEDLNFASVTPSGYRIRNVIGNDDVTVSFSEDAPLDATFTINCATDEKKIIPLDVYFTDTWYLTINYLKQFNNSPFAEHKTATKIVTVSDYGDIRTITDEQVAKLLGFEHLKIFPIEGSKDNRYMSQGYVLRLKDEHGAYTEVADPQKFVYNGASEYVLTLEYSYVAMRKLNSDGSQEELQIPLTCYDTWCKGISEKWSIFWLNRGDDGNWFQFSNDVDRDKLYGFFHSATFEERVSDINSIFKGFTYDGAVVLNESTGVTGTEMYKLYNNMLGTIWHIGGIAGMLFEEWTDICFDDGVKNAQLYTYFFYLDCSSTKTFIAHNNAQNSEDAESAVKNQLDEILAQMEKNTFKYWWNNSTGAKILKWVLGILGGALLLYVVVRLAKKAWG